MYYLVSRKSSMDTSRDQFDDPLYHKKMLTFTTSIKYLANLVKLQKMPIFFFFSFFFSSCFL